MDNQIVRLCSSLEAAERAREELLAAGFPRDRVELQVRDDEAGPPQANFTVGDDPSVTGTSDYKGTFKPRGRDPSRCIVVVSAPDADWAARASAILDRADPAGVGGVA
ncbi:MAG: hypothetical protein ACJ8LG_13990 [Massilia sp.]